MNSCPYDAAEFLLFSLRPTSALAPVLSLEGGQRGWSATRHGEMKGACGRSRRVSCRMFKANGQECSFVVDANLIYRCSQPTPWPSQRGKISTFLPGQSLDRVPDCSLTTPWPPLPRGK